MSNDNEENDGNVVDFLSYKKKEDKKKEPVKRKTQTKEDPDEEGEVSAYTVVNSIQTFISIFKKEGIPIKNLESMLTLVEEQAKENKEYGYEEVEQLKEMLNLCIKMYAIREKFPDLYKMYKTGSIHSALAIFMEVYTSEYFSND